MVECDSVPAFRGVFMAAPEGRDMKAKALALLACAIMASVSFVACSSGSDDAPKTVNITDVGFSIANRPTDWYSASATNKPNLVYNFTLVLEGNMTAADIASAKVFLPNSDTSSWSFTPAEDFDPAKKSIYGGFFDDGRTVGGVPNAGSGVELPIGTMKAVVKLTNGVSSSYDFTMGVPGSTSTGGMSYVYSPDDEAGAVEPSISAPALQRPTVTAFTGGGPDPLVVSFAILGNDVHNGWVWFYDSSDEYVGEFYPFRARSDGTASVRLNGAAFNAENGGTNTLTVGASDIHYNNTAISSAAFSAISSCRVVVCDGAQYEAADRWTWYDYKAVSTRAVLIPN
jgi:hypothetical protein